MKRALLVPAAALAAGLGLVSFPVESPAQAQSSTSTPDAAAADVSLSTDQLAVSEFAADGVTVTATNLSPGDEITLEIVRRGESAAAESATATANTGGTATHTFTGEREGTYDVTVGGAVTKTLAFTVSSSTPSTTHTTSNGLLTYQIRIIGSSACPE